MGADASIPKYSKRVCEKTSGETAIFRNPLAEKSFISTPEPGMLTVQDIYLQSFRIFCDKPYLCMRDEKKNRKYSTKTYSQIYQEAREFGSGLLELNTVLEVNEYNNMKFGNIF